MRATSKLFRDRLFEVASMRGRFYVQVGTGSDPATWVGGARKALKELGATRPEKPLKAKAAGAVAVH